MSIRFQSSVGRHGLSFVEFIGCLAAVAGGLVLGSLYFGVDVKEAAVGALEYAQVMPTTNDAASNAVAPTTPVDASQAKPTTETASKAADGNSAAASSSTTVLPTAGPTSTEPAKAEAITVTPEQRAKLSREYWDALNAHMKTEADNRANQSDGAWEIHDYLSSRSAGHRTAAESIARLSLRGVDGHVSAFAKRVLAWHEEGAAMFSHAKDLVTDAPTAQLSGPFAQEWQSAVTQHQMEERLLAEKHAALQSYLDHAGRSDKTDVAAGE
jgi:hypothetical protein